MPHASIPLLSQYLLRLKAHYGQPSTDRELLQRFVAHRDQSAFASLVERHAAMVLRLCRSILRNHHDAEDIFQAVFLVLARKAGSIRKGDSVGSWLYAVAYRLAHKVRIREGKRRLYDHQQAKPQEQTPMDEVTWGELRDVLNEEVSRLPEKYRAAIVLCYWQGRTHEQAGRQLGCARATIKDRLEKARAMLRTRLARRGLALPAAWFAASLSEGTSSAVSAELMNDTLRGAMLFSMGQSPSEFVSSSVIAYTREIVKGKFMNNLTYGLVLLMLGTLGGSVGLALIRELPWSEEQAEQSTVEAAKPELEHSESPDDPLPAGAVARLGTLRFRHNELVNQIAIGADGTSILSASGKAVYVWDLASGKVRQRFAHDHSVTSFVHSRNGKMLASGCQDGSIHVWDTTTGREVNLFAAPKGRSPDWKGPSGGYVRGLSPDGRQVVSIHATNAIYIWDMVSGEKVHEFGGFKSIAGVSLAPDGKTLAGVVKDDKTWELRLWETATGREIARKPQPGKQILCPTFSPDGTILAIAVGEEDWKKPCEIQLWTADASKVIRTLRGHDHWAWFQFAPEGKTLASWSSGEKGAGLWDVNTGREIKRIGSDESPFTQLVFCLDGKTMASNLQGHHIIRFWDRASGKEIRSSSDAETAIDFLSFSPDGRLLATGSRGHWTIRLWDVAARKQVRRLQSGLLSGLQFSPDGGRLATTAWTDAQVHIWKVSNGGELRQIASNKGARSIDCLAWAGDGKVLATWGVGDRLIRLWNAESGEPLRELSCGADHIESLVFSPDGKELATLGTELRPPNRTLILRWDVDTGRQLPSLDAPTGPAVAGGYYALARLAFSPDGRMLACGGQGSKASIYLWEVASAQLRLILNQDEDVASLAFSPDGKFLAAANNINNALQRIAQGIVAPQRDMKFQPTRVHLWDIASDNELRQLEGHQGSVTSLSFSPDGTLLATGSNDTTVLLWDTTPFKTTPPARVQLRPEQMEALWTDLAGADAAKAYRAIRTLAAAPESSAAFLKRHLHPIKPADAKRVARLLTDLDSDQFDMREKAMQELEKLGDRAATELHKALAEKPPLEVKRRIEQLLEKQNGEEHLRMVRAIETLERMGTSEAREICAALAAGVPDAPLTREARATLGRMTR